MIDRPKLSEELSQITVRARLEKATFKQDTEQWYRTVDVSQREKKTKQKKRK